jgi:predicted nucleotidyltransferase
MSQTTAPVWAVTPEKIQEAVRRLVEAARPLKIILFGSRARGAAKEDSDLDLMVVTGPLQDADRLKESVRLRDVLRPLRLAVDLLVVPQEKLDYWGDTPGNVYYEAKQDGVILYEQR